MPLLTSLQLQPCPDGDYKGCYVHLADLPELSDWLTAYGFRIAHACGHRMIDRLSIHAEEPLPLEWEFMDWILWSLDSQLVPFVATFRDENGRSITVYPTPGAGSLLRPNTDEARALLVEVAR